MIQKKNPKKNPVHHKIETVSDIFRILNSKNLNKFMKEFKQGMQVGIATRELAKSIAKANNPDIPFPENILDMPSFTWIED